MNDYTNQKKCQYYKMKQLISHNFMGRKNYIKIKVKKDNETALLLRKEIEKEPYFNLKDWLLEKIEKL